MQVWVEEFLFERFEMNFEVLDQRKSFGFLHKNTHNQRNKYRGVKSNSLTGKFKLNNTRFYVYVDFWKF